MSIPYSPAFSQEKEVADTVITSAGKENITKPPGWMIVLPLRFTHLQNSNTLLSGIKLGRIINQRVNLSLSIYHSFYGNSIRPKADLSDFANEEPRNFVYSLGAEADYKFAESRKVAVWFQLYVGWGFMNYHLKDLHFKSTTVHYAAIEPLVNAEYKIGKSTGLGLGIGYRPLLARKNMEYVSDISDGIIPINKPFPNGLVIALSLKGYF